MLLPDMTVIFMVFSLGLALAMSAEWASVPITSSAGKFRCYALHAAVIHGKRMAVGTQRILGRCGRCGLSARKHFHLQCSVGRDRIFQVAFRLKKLSAE
jgi:hypothetical protein